MTAKAGRVLSLDQAAAFDNVDHNYVIEVIRALGFSREILNFVQTLYRDSHIILRTRHVLTQKLPILKGVKQGDPVAPLLFIMAMEPLLRRLSMRVFSIKG